ncbi:fused FliR family export protein/FlhB family type III secretion system protein [Clostridium oryzae]|uniref:Flagellar biosynthetic protein FliR n=1 Tax=Clostridium oryzae TaxID=1450648 RepID=A0A1V4ITZ8_9CLOT|nr:fused FliR family export protein/FlhB family type III secretion system protein [Clostridium oryzae]OPJ63265.1 flagellar biosynthetic protein FlhB [Clostridium oryzae]
MIDTVYFTALILIFIRLVTFVALVPIFFPKGTPNIMKAFIAGVLAIIIAPTVDATSIKSINDNYTLALYVVNEFAIGIVLGSIVSMVLSMLKLAGQLLDLQMGLAMMSLFDPNSNTNSTLMETFFYWIALMVFILSDGHLVLLKAIIQSFQIVNLGHGILYSGTMMVAITSLIKVFVIAFRIAIPLILVLMITDITLGLVSRTVPQLNVMLLGIPVKIAVGLTIVAFAMPEIVKSMVIVFQNIPDIFNSVYKAIPMVLIFAAGDDKTEEATPKKKGDARKKGQVARSRDVGLALTLLAATVVISAAGGSVGRELEKTLVYFLSDNIRDISALTAGKVGYMAIVIIAKIFFPVILPIMLMGIAASYFQTGFLFTLDTIKPKFSGMDPLAGFKRMFSSRTFVNLIKDIIVVTIVGFIGYRFLMSNYSEILKLGFVAVDRVPKQFGNYVLDIMRQIALVMIIIAGADYFYQKYKYKKDMKMSKQEVKEEFKQQEGDPKIKGKIRQKQREMATRRMMAKIPDATVVITNPTHVAVALKYEEGGSEAPVVIAKGLDLVAYNIKKIAKENDIPIIENKPLARLMYEEVDLDREIPVSMYQAVAEILAVIYAMKKKK